MSRTPRLISDADFTAWLAHAASGERLTYWRGHLAFDASPLTSELSNEDRVRLGSIGDLARRMAQMGFVHLLQQRHGAKDFSYVAVVRPRVQLLASATGRLPAKVVA